MSDLSHILEPLITPRRRERVLKTLHSRLGALRVVVENFHDPHNMNAVLRTCEALGVQHIHAVEADADFSINRKITKGSHKWLTLHRHTEFAPCAAELKAAGFRLYAAMPAPDAMPLHELPVDRPVALVFGNESVGVSPEALAQCDGRYVIPMSGLVESLNASVAAAISIYDVATRMRGLRADAGLLSPGERDELLDHWLPKTARNGKRIQAIVSRKPSRKTP